ncbi:copper transporter [Romboutsia sp. CE17]|uniref:copper transporter n=1 Tax=Romboutsia sp. CE17 TaxID=2724150 RepID=UPI001442AA23|nr:copper transporter [Romboutsia sp. CE17]QJA09174.1 copper transporter [Romboutsia sp. CE17]
MHINMKYYIVTIGAIFISLGIGMLVGFNLNYDQELSKQQAQIINDLDVKFEDLRDTNNNLEAKLKNVNNSYDKVVDFINQNVDKLIVEELTDKYIGIISTNENCDTTNIYNTILKANGNVAFDIKLNSNITDKSVLANLSSKLGEEIKSTDELINYIIEALKNEGAKDKLTYLEELGILTLSELSDSYQSYTSVVLTGKSSNKDLESQFKEIDKSLIDKIKSENKYVVGVEDAETKLSYIDLYSENKISTIDNINQGSGQLALVLALKDESIVGKFGISENAESIIPFK